MFRSSSKKMAVSFTIISDVAVATRVSVNKKGADLFIKAIFIPEQSVSFILRSNNYFQIAKSYGLWKLLTKLDLNCNDFLPRNGRTQVSCFLGANKYTSFLTYKLFRYFLMQKSVKLTG